ncbi:COPII subunit [Gryganskiella cystojenkinii]|nr:COPII subunit [Gryganskiella cystojenkinii]
MPQQQQYQQQQQQVQHPTQSPMNRPMTPAGMHQQQQQLPGHPGQPGQQQQFRPRPANSPAGMPRPALGLDPSNRRPSATSGPMPPPSPSSQRPPMASAPFGSHPGHQQQQHPSHGGQPMQRPPPIGGIQRAPSPLIRPAMTAVAQPGSPANQRPYQSPQIQNRLPPSPFTGHGQATPASPAMNPMGFNAAPNGFGANNQSHPPTPQMPNQPPQQSHQQYQQSHQQQQQHQMPPSYAQGPGANTPNLGGSGMIPGPPTPTPQAAGTGSHKPKRMYPTSINSYTEPAAPPAYDAIPNPGFVPAAGPSPVSQASNMNHQMPMTPQFFVPGEKQGGAPAPVQGYQQGPQPLHPGQPLQPNVNQLAHQMGGMNVSNGSFGGPGLPQLSTVALMGSAPKILDLDLPPPPINLPANASITQSPYANCDPSYKRSTLNAIPATSQLLSKSRLPFGLVITPYRSVKEGDTQQPVDRWQRKELNHAVVEYIAPTEYMVRPPQPLVYMILIDVSYPAIQCGMVATAATTILESLDRIPNDEGRTKIGIITVDSSIHFYNLNTTSGEPQMLVVSDLEEAYLPQPEDLLCNLSECRPTLEILLNRLHDMFKDTQNVGNALGPALNSAYKLISPIGGKILCLQSSLPNLEAGALKVREDPKLLGTSKESTLLQSGSSFYKNFAVDCSKSQVCVDMFLFGSQYSDVATLSCLPRFTGGSTFFYPAFTAAKSEDALKFAHELAEFLSQRIALEAVMRVRASKGLRMSAFYGNFFVRSTDLLSLPNVPRDQSYSIEISFDENLNIPTVCFQTALLHTSSSGERRIRVLTLAVPVTTSLSELYMSADQVAIATLLSCKAVERGMNSKLDDARDALTNKCVDILGVYKTHMTASSSGATPNLQICDNLKLLPLLTLGMLKHVGLRGGSQIPSDLRSYAMHLLSTLPSQCLIPFLHPRFYSLHNMPEHCGTVGTDGIQMPQTMNLSSERLERGGLFMLEDGQNIFLWVGREAVPQLCMDLFGVPNYESIRGGKTTLPTLETDFNQRVNLIVGKTREMRRSSYFPQLYVIKEDGDAALRLWFLSHLIEDRAEPIMSYYQYLGHLKDRVNSGSF